MSLSSSLSVRFYAAAAVAIAIGTGVGWSFSLTDMDLRESFRPALLISAILSSLLFVEIFCLALLRIFQRMVTKKKFKRWSPSLLSTAIFCTGIGLFATIMSYSAFTGKI
jgi:glucan phosphoethanolaminetransferase (alkaline phosphatase superfamily)